MVLCAAHAYTARIIKIIPLKQPFTVTSSSSLPIRDQGRHRHISETYPEHSPSSSSPRQPSTTPDEPPSPSSPPPPPPKKQKKTELENQDKLLDPAKLKFFIGMKESNRRKFIEPPLLSDYDRSIKKSYDKRKSGSSSSGGVPQLGAQQKSQ